MYFYNNTRHNFKVFTENYWGNSVTYYVIERSEPLFHITTNTRQLCQLLPLNQHKLTKDEFIGQEVPESLHAHGLRSWSSCCFVSLKKKKKKQVKLSQWRNSCSGCEEAQGTLNCQTGMESQRLLTAHAHNNLNITVESTTYLNQHQNVKPVTTE